MRFITQALLAFGCLTISNMISMAAWGGSPCKLDVPKDPPENPTLVDQMERFVSVRKSFNGSLKDSQAPAEIAYENPDGTDNYARIDLAIKFVGWDCSPSGKTLFHSRIKPIFEYHRSNNSLEQVKKTSISAVYQAEVGLDYEFRNAILTDLKYERTRDSVLDQTVRVDSIKVAWSSDAKFAPGYTFRTADKMRVFKYMLSIGYERYNKLPIKQKVGDTTVVVAPAVDENLYTGRLNLDFRPFADQLGESLVVTATQTWRKLDGASDVVPKSSDLLELSLDYYLDPKKRVAFGVSYSNGYNPARNFLDEEVSAIGFKFKLGGD